MNWSPDTCTGDVNTGCCMEFNGMNIPANFVRFVTLCPRHAAAGASISIIHEENTRKTLFSDIAKTKVANLDDVQDYTWFYNLDGVLEIRLVRILTTKQKRDIQIACDTYFGMNKVKIL